MVKWQRRDKPRLAVSRRSFHLRREHLPSTRGTSHAEAGATGYAGDRRGRRGHTAAGFSVRSPGLQG